MIFGHRGLKHKVRIKLDVTKDVKERFRSITDKSKNGRFRDQF